MSIIFTHLVLFFDKYFYPMVQKKVTKNGTEKSNIMPCKMEMNTISFPEYLVIMGRVVSIVVAPPTQIGANFPKYLESKGANNKAITSLIILAIKAIVPNSVANITPTMGSLS